jgi:hypothetical protein
MNIPRQGLVAEYLFGGNPDDTSGHGRHGTVRGASLTADRFGQAASAFHFDGVDDEIIVAPPPPLPSGILSVSVWARFERTSLDGWTNCIIAQDDGDDHDQSRRVFQLSAHDGHVVWHRMVGARDPIVKRRIRFGEWCHFTAVVENGVHTLYADGVRCDAVEHRFWTHADQPLHIGRKGTAEQHFFFRGDIDDVRIYDRALSVEEVAGLYAERGFTKPAQAPRIQRISGRWGQRGVLFLDLRNDGGRAITGRVMNGRPGNYAPIERGTFDAERGEFRLEGRAPQLKTGVVQDYAIEGVVDDGEVTVSARFGDWRDNLVFTRNGARMPWRYALVRRIDAAVRRVLGIS